MLLELTIKGGFNLIEAYVMRLFLFILPVLFLTNARAQIFCPPAMTCDYETGLCDNPGGWILDAGSAREPFTGPQIIKISKAVAYKVGPPPNEEWQFSCGYSYGKYSSMSIYRYVKALNGINWVFSGFGNSKADCMPIIDPTTGKTTIDPNSCGGE